MPSPTKLRWLSPLAGVTALVTACSPASPPPDAGGSTVPPGTGATASTGTASTGTASTGTASTGTASTGTASAGSAVVGTWMSPSCGERTYARELELMADNTFRSADLVSPCPPKVVCVWSGIVNREGTYRVEDGKVILTEEGQGGSPAKPLPAFLTIDPSGGTTLIEPDGGGKGCPYTRTSGKKAKE